MKINPDKKYLPSRPFIKKVAVISILLLLVFIITQVIPSLRAQLQENKLAKTLLVKDLVIQDQNLNGIQDWEEALWGLDPSTDGESNREYILSKKKLLNQDNIPEGELTENDKMAREFFALVVSLQQSGNLNDESMKVLAESISTKVANSTIEDIYTDNNLNIVTTSPTSLKSYYSELQKINKKHEGEEIGDELTFVGQAIANHDTQALKLAVEMSKSYRDFGTDLMAMPVPTSLVLMHLELANNYEKNAQALESMNGMLDTPVSGMSAVIKYKKYNDALIETIQKLTSFFKRNGIIK